MCSEAALVKTDTGDPLIDQPGILARRHGTAVVAATWEEEFSRPCSAGSEVLIKGLAGLLS
jgi:hypothetical protein